MTLGYIDHTRAENAVDADEHGVAGFDEVDDAGFHSGRAGAADGEGEFVLGLEDVAEHLLGFVHDANKFRVEMADQRHRHGGQHARVDIGWAGTHEDAGRGRELRDRGSGNGW